MSRVVVDASVVVKWLIPDRDGETDTDQALTLLAAIRDGSVQLIQPPHWLAEVAAVLARLSPDTVEEDVGDLYAMQLPVLDSPEVYLTACELSRSLGQHLFDTLYHAVALEVAGGWLVTADERYHRKASARGAISLLRDTSFPSGEIGASSDG